MKKFVPLFIMFSFLASATPKQLIDTFSRCDLHFFAVIHDNQAELSHFFPIEEINSQYAYIPVPNRNDTNKNSITFNEPIEFDGLTIIGYYDSAMAFNAIGDYYFWGFIVDNDLGEIKNSLNTIDWIVQEENLFYISNPLIRHSDDNLNAWTINKGTTTGVKTIPAPHTTEKLLILERSENTSLLLCSIQGFVPIELLHQERPDIKERPVIQISDTK